MTRNPIIRSWNGKGGIADNFAGGGGVSLAFLRALGRAPDHAINHDDEALAMHAANHPETEHHCESVWKIDPRVLFALIRCWAAWFSPDCKDHSSAKGGKPVDKKIRSLAWVMVRWAKLVAPEVMFLENVPEFRDWGPCIEIDGEMRRDPKRKGQTFRAFVRKLESYGYVVDWRILKAADYGSPTSRKRLFMVARRDGQPIVWPEPTHGPALLGLKPYHTAAECLDFSLPTPSIFLTRTQAQKYTRMTGQQIKRPLVENTLARIAYGVKEFVIDALEPFIVCLRGTEESHLRSSAGSLHDPLRTINAGGWHHSLVVPYLVPSGHGAKGAPDRRAHSIEEPVPTITAESRSSFAVITPHLIRYNGTSVGQSLEDPLSTVDTRDRFALVAPLLIQSGYGERPGQSPRTLDLREPLGTVVAGGVKHGLATAIFIENGNSMRTTGGLNIGHLPNQPMSTVTAQRQKGIVAVSFDGARVEKVRRMLARFGVSNKVVIGGEERTIGDIGYRLLVPRELYRAQGVGDDYIINPIGPDGSPLNATAQIRMCGNMVPPHPAEALIRGNLLEAA